MKAFLKKKISDKKGFTLAELLVVVAIIAILVAISIPIFTAQLKKAREATDLANIRSAYAEASSDAITNNGTGEATTDETMKCDTWDTINGAKIGGVEINTTNCPKTKDKEMTVKVTDTDGNTTVTFTSAK